MTRNPKRTAAGLAFAVALTLAAGCSSGSVEGMPEGAQAGKAPEELTGQMKQFAKEGKTRRAGPKAPPLGPLPKH